MTPVNSAAGALALRTAANTRWSRAHENGERMGEMQLAAPSWMGRATGLADALHRLEFDLACHQNRLARFAADFIRGDSFSDRDHGAASCFDRPRAVAPAASQRLRGPGNYWNPHVRCELHLAVLGGATRLIRSCCCS